MADKIKYVDKRDVHAIRSVLRVFKEYDRIDALKNIKARRKTLNELYKACINSRVKHASETYFQNIGYWNGDVNFGMLEGLCSEYFFLNFVNHAYKESKGKLLAYDMDTIKNKMIFTLCNQSLRSLLAKNVINMPGRLEALITAIEVGNKMGYFNKTYKDKLISLVHDMKKRHATYAKLPF